VPTFLRAEGEPEYEPSSDVIGSGGLYTFRFEVASIGEGELIFVYQRPWEEEVEPIEYFSVEIVIE